ncbi:MAG: hypothetical protein AseanaTS_13220 [Candidatus Pelagadaptatus aseana]|uniref:LexA family protein n=1 Tax=Candidatus Pelagadaptatus aseana TaxID=3120508 RepID=UPI0039B1CE6F
MTAISIISEHEAREALSLPCYGTRVPAGFPSPADDYMPRKLDLNEYLIQHPAATFYCRVNGESMQDLGIMDGCLLIVDRAEQYQNGSIVLAAINGDITCKILDTGQRKLRSGNPKFPAIDIPEELDVIIEGVVIHAINSYAGTGRL